MSETTIHTNVYSSNGRTATMAIALLHRRGTRKRATAVSQGRPNPKVKPKKSLRPDEPKRIIGWRSCQKNIALPTHSRATSLQRFDKVDRFTPSTSAIVTRCLKATCHNQISASNPPDCQYSHRYSLYRRGYRLLLGLLSRPAENVRLAHHAGNSTRRCLPRRSRHPPHPRENSRRRSLRTGLCHCRGPDVPDGCHAAAGSRELSEVFGTVTLETDVESRRLRLRRVAEQIYTTLPEADKATPPPMRAASTLISNLITGAMGSSSPCSVTIRDRGASSIRCSPASTCIARSPIHGN